MENNKKCEDTGKSYYLRPDAIAHFQCKNCERFWSSADQKPMCTSVSEEASKATVTCLSLDCPERTGGVCRHAGMLNEAPKEDKI